MHTRKSSSNTSSHTRRTTGGSGRVSAAAKRVNKRKYGALLANALPAVIKLEEENERMLALAEQLIDKGESRTPEEDQLFELVTKLIEDFEEEHYPIPDASPHRVLRFLMEQNDLRPQRPAADFRLTRLRL
jgi:hypothetical protein